MIRLALICTVFGYGISADALVATRTIPAQSIIGYDDLQLRDIEVSGGEVDLLLFVGMESRVALYAGRPVRVGDVGAPAIVERNQIIGLVFQQNGLRISTEGRALARAGPGDIIRVMNLSSRNTIRARIDENGDAIVSQ